jgi:hypothetical protein
MLDIVDLRTLRKVLELAGLQGARASPPSIGEFLRNQAFVQQGTNITAIVDELKAQRIVSDQPAETA